MKIFTLVIAFSVLQTPNLLSQNVGIGTTTPLTKLHIFNGASGNLTPFAPLVVENNNHTYINLLSPNAFETSVLFGKAENAASGGIIYNNATNPNGFQFRTNGNATKVVITNNGNLGIGITNPNAPLAFPAALGKKITLYPGGTGDVGLAVQGNLLQIYSDHPNADIAFGYDQAGVMTERFRMRANGALRINGNDGQSGQVLTSKGGGAAAEWTAPTNALHNNMHLFSQSATASGVVNYVTLPGLTQTFTSPKGKAMIILKGQMFNNGCFGCGNHTAKFDIVMDGVLIDRNIITVGNGLEMLVTNGALIYPLAAGSHTITINVDGNFGNFSAYGFRAIVVVIPE